MVSGRGLSCNISDFLNWRCQGLNWNLFSAKLLLCHWAIVPLLKMEQLVKIYFMTVNSKGHTYSQCKCKWFPGSLYCLNKVEIGFCEHFPTLYCYDWDMLWIFAVYLDCGHWWFCWRKQLVHWWLWAVLCKDKCSTWYDQELCMCINMERSSVSGCLCMLSPSLSMELPRIALEFIVKALYTKKSLRPLVVRRQELPHALVAV